MYFAEIFYENVLQTSYDPFKINPSLIKVLTTFTSHSFVDKSSINASIVTFKYLLPYLRSSYDSLQIIPSMILRLVLTLFVNFSI
jgi:hypothetical protein